MSRNSKMKKQSTKKYLNFKSLPLIPIIAIVEVLVLIVVSTYAWFYLSTNKQVSVGTVSVDADSGLDIDFKYAKEEDYINIWKYIDQDFEFEPVTSLDGRNVFVPTTGTMKNTDTSNMKFREGTVNDINSKYINIDFEMTNTTDYDMKVYLNNNSYFNVKNPTSGAKDESRALRLAFYPNDASIGNVGSSLIGGSDDYSWREEQPDDPNMKRIYFDNTEWYTGGDGKRYAKKKWDKVYAYVWNSSDTTGTEYLQAWPGVEMSRDSGPIYSLGYSDTNSYNKVIFNNGSGTQTATYNLTDGNVYSTSSSGSPYNSNTVYFVKPNSWNNVYVHAWRRENGVDQFYTNWDNGASGLDEMTNVGSGIYSYTFSSEVSGLIFTSGTWGGNTQTENITPVDGMVYYTRTYSSSTGAGTTKNTVDSYKRNNVPVEYSDLTTKTVFFYNSLGWSTPYAYAKMAISPGSSGDGVNSIQVAMTSLTSNVYYCNIPEIYSYVYFGAKEDTANHRTTLITYENGYVYRTLETKSGSYYNVEDFEYANYSATTGYAVISPGVSAGFQRSYSPVVGINNDSGIATQVIPAFANSIDNYIYGNTAGPVDPSTHNPTSQTVFEIESKHVLSLSMVIWLEGTDPSCTGKTYAGNQIELRLEFASSYFDTVQNKEIKVNTYGSESYTYKFYDKTREVWTADRQSTESGITVAPVMQLYDNTVGRGYLMHPDTYVTKDGKTKVSCWTVDAPQTVALKGHDIIFRRVNPYDEDEVWNYWHAGPCAGKGDNTTPPITDKKSDVTYPIYDIAFSGGNTVSFTAFADGSPTGDILLQNGNDQADVNDADLPAVSCGGLWGNHNVRTLTVVDGLQGHPCKNTDKSDTSGLMTMSYSFKYSSSQHNRTVKIEYKASGPSKSVFYFFVVPDALYTASDPTASNAQGLRCTFKNYFNYTSKYAINSDRNTIKYRGRNDRYSKIAISDAPCGDYLMLNETKGKSFQNYWGGDVLYVETNSDTSDYATTASDKGKLLQVRYYDQNNESNTNKYSYLYAVENDSSFSSATTAFVSVVPSDSSKWYNSCKVEICEYNNPSNKYCWTGRINLPGASETVNANGIGSNKTFNRNHLEDNKNICKITSILTTVYFQSQNRSLDRKDYGQGPCAYLWQGNYNNGFPGWEMTDMVDKGNNKFEWRVSFNPLQYNWIQFNNGTSNIKTNDINIGCNKSYVFDVGYGLNASQTYTDTSHEIVNKEFYVTTNPHYTYKAS